MHDGQTKVKIADIQVSLAQVFTFLFGVGGVLSVLVAILLFIGTLMFVDKKEFGLHKEENIKACAELSQRVDQVKNEILVKTTTKSSHRTRPAPADEN